MVQVRGMHYYIQSQVMKKTALCPGDIYLQSYVMEHDYYHFKDILQINYFLNSFTLLHRVSYIIYIHPVLGYRNIREAGVAFHLHQDLPKRHSENKTYERVSVCGQKR